MSLPVTVTLTERTCITVALNVTKIYVLTVTVTMAITTNLSNTVWQTDGRTQLPELALGHNASCGITVRIMVRRTAHTACSARKIAYRYISWLGLMHLTPDALTLQYRGLNAFRTYWVTLLAAGGSSLAEPRSLCLCLHAEEAEALEKLGQVCVTAHGMI